MPAPPQQKKKETMEEVAQLINTILDQAAKSRGDFTPELMRQYETAGLEARKRGQQAGKATPSRELGAIVARRSEGKNEGAAAERLVARRPEVTVKVDRKAMDAGIDLATDLEMAAATGKRFEPGQWIKAGMKG
jgi:hypothetical protein